MSPLFVAVLVSAIVALLIIGVAVDVCLAVQVRRARALRRGGHHRRPAWVDEQTYLFPPVDPWAGAVAG